MRASSLYLSVILVIIVIIIAHLAWCQWRHHRGKEAEPLYDAAAPPEAQAAAADLAGALSSMGAASRKFEGMVPDLGALQPYFADAQKSSAMLRTALEGFLSQLVGGPPTAANLHAVHSGLTSISGQLQSGADAYMSAARNLLTGISGMSETTAEAALKKMVMGSLATKGRGVIPDMGGASSLPEAPALNAVKSTAAAAVIAPISSALNDVGLTLNQVSGAVHALGAKIGAE
jgi:hypothetical protein